MASKDKRPRQSPKPRQRTEKTPPQTPRPPEEFDALSPEEMRRMLHELQARQAELEKQNEALCTAQAKEAQQGEKLYHSLFDHMLNGFAYCRMLFDQGVPRDFIYLAVNEAFETQTGLKNVVGRKVSEVIPGIREADPRLFEIYARVATTGKPEHFEMFVEALRDWFSISVYCPAPEHFVAVFDVITERKRAQDALRASETLNRRLLEHLPHRVFVKDRNSVYVSCNANYARDLGMAPEQVVGKDDFVAEGFQSLG